MPQEQPATISEAEFALVADHASIGLIRFDASLRVRLANQAAHHALERRPGSLVGKTLMGTFVDHRLEELVRAAAAGEAGWRELESVDRVSITVRARPAAGGGAWVTLENVTELQRLRRIRSEFIDNLSHELRTPLANIRLLTEMLMDDLEHEEVSTRTSASEWRPSTSRRAISSRWSTSCSTCRASSRLPPASAATRCSLPPLVTATLHRLRTFADRQGVVLVELVPDDLPPVRGDEERLDQLLMNLLHNAIKFSPQGGTVTITTDELPTASSSPSPTTAWASRRRTRTASSSATTRWTAPVSAAWGAPASGWPSPGTSPRRTAARIWLESTEGKGSTFSFSVPFA